MSQSRSNSWSTFPVSLQWICESIVPFLSCLKPLNKAWYRSGTKC
jgi:hypothetical protein